jgi:hypothetical protein
MRVSLRVDMRVVIMRAKIRHEYSPRVLVDMYYYACIGISTAREGALILF